MFKLNDTLENDSIFIKEIDISQLRLMNDSRFLWLILVPQIENAVELHDLSLFQQAQIFEETMRIAQALKEIDAIDKVNIGAIGNVVSQLHIHIIGRKIGDDVWPAPVWGNGEKQPYKDASNLIEKIKGVI